MKKIITLIFLSGFLALSQVLFAQQDPAAKKILDQMSNTYQQMSAYEAVFLYQFKGANQEEVEEEMKGSITVQGNMFRMKTDDQEVLNNSKKVWTYTKDNEEILITDNEEDNEINPTKIYTMYKEGFKYLFVEEVKKGNATMQVVDLIPENKDLDYFKVRLYIDKTKQTLNSWTIFQKNGMHFTFQILEFKSDVKLADNFFIFNRKNYPQNIEVIDLTQD